MGFRPFRGVGFAAPCGTGLVDFGTGTGQYRAARQISPAGFQQPGT